MRRAGLVMATCCLVASFVPPAGAAPRLCMGQRVTIAGRRVVRGTAGDDVILGSRKDDRIFAGGGDDVVCGGGGDDDVRGGSGSDHVLAGGGNDRVYAGADGDVVAGGKGPDTLEGQAGDDRVDGGAGRDQASFGGASGEVTVDLAAGTAEGEGTDALTSIEDVWGSTFSDTISGDDGANHLGGGGGDDVIEGRAGNDWIDGWDDDDTLSGGAGEDDLQGWDGGDVLHGDAGDDELSGQGGDDVLDGGADVDMLDYSFFGPDGGIDVNLTTGVASGDGLDVLTAVEDVLGTIDADDITGNSEANALYGDGGPDTLSGLGGADLIGVSHCCGDEGFSADGGMGPDRIVASGDGTIAGGEGDDVFTTSMDGATIDGGLGADVVDYTEVFDWHLPSSGVWFDVEVDLLTGLARQRGCSLPCPHDTLTGIEGATGEAGNDLLIGTLGPNVLTGGVGNDELVGGEGDDVLDGGLDYEGDSGDGGGGNDTCIDVERPTSCEVVDP